MCLLCEFLQCASYLDCNNTAAIGGRATCVRYRLNGLGITLSDLTSQFPCHALTGGERTDVREVLWTLGHRSYRNPQRIAMIGCVHCHARPILTGARAKFAVDGSRRTW